MFEWSRNVSGKSARAKSIRVLNAANDCRQNASNLERNTNVGQVERTTYQLVHTRYAY